MLTYLTFYVIIVERWLSLRFHSCFRPIDRFYRQSTLHLLLQLDIKLIARCEVLMFEGQPFGDNSVIEFVLVQALRNLLFEEVEIVFAEANIQLLLGIDVLKFVSLPARGGWFFGRGRRVGAIDLVESGASAGGSHSIFFKF